MYSITTRAQIGIAAEVPSEYVGANINAQLVRLNGGPAYPAETLSGWLNFLRKQGVIDGLTTGTAQKLYRSAEMTRLRSAKMTHYLEKKNGRVFSFLFPSSHFQEVGLRNLG